MHQNGLSQGWRIPAEWEHQAGTLLVWPDEQTDWNQYLDQIQETYIRLIRLILKYQPVYLCSRKPVFIDPVQDSQFQLQQINIDFDDTWVRDSGPLTAVNEQRTSWLDFRFNGWGNKFNARQDDALVQSLLSTPLFRHQTTQHYHWVLEGGAVEFDGQGRLLTTWSCLNRRYPELSRLQHTQKIQALLNVDKVMWLDNGKIIGDDTDGHIDMLARFANPHSIVYQGCQDPLDPHYESLKKMQIQIESFRQADGSPYVCYELPFPGRAEYEQTRLPASYANFLILNDAVIMPTYESESDQQAQAVIQQAFPDRTIESLDSRVLIRQGGSIHCASMQLYGPERLNAENCTNTTS